MIQVKEAIQRGLEFLGDVLKGDDLRDTRLEEIQLSENWDEWYITFSFLRGGAPSELASAIEHGPRREYKVIVMSAENGRVLAMKIRQPETA